MKISTNISISIVVVVSLFLGCSESICTEDVVSNCVKEFQPPKNDTEETACLEISKVEKCLSNAECTSSNNFVALRWISIKTHYDCSSGNSNSVCDSSSAGKCTEQFHTNDDTTEGICGQIATIDQCLSNAGCNASSSFSSQWNATKWRYTDNCNRQSSGNSSCNRDSVGNCVSQCQSQFQSSDKRNTNKTVCLRWIADADNCLYTAGCMSTNFYVGLLWTPVKTVRTNQCSNYTDSIKTENTSNVGADLQGFDHITILLLSLTMLSLICKHFS